METYIYHTDNILVLTHVAAPPLETRVFRAFYAKFRPASRSGLIQHISLQIKSDTRLKFIKQNIIGRHARCHTDT